MQVKDLTVIGMLSLDDAMYFTNFDKKRLEETEFSERINNWNYQIPFSVHSRLDKDSVSSLIEIQYVPPKIAPKFHPHEPIFY